MLEWICLQRANVPLRALDGISLNTCASASMMMLLTGGLLFAGPCIIKIQEPAAIMTLEFVTLSQLESPISLLKDTQTFDPSSQSNYLKINFQAILISETNICHT